MKKQKLAILLTCHNRKNKTIACLRSLYGANIPPKFDIDIYLTDDGSTDGTSEFVSEMFPQIKLIKGDGTLFWAGGMRLAWKTAMRNNLYDAYLLLNDDVVLHSNYFQNLIETDDFVYAKTGKKGIYSGSTIDSSNNEVTYGGYRVSNYLFVVRLKKLIPDGKPQECHLTNANVLWVSKDVVDKIGIFDFNFTHGIADYDYTLEATRRKIPVFITPNVCGVCEDDHGKNWRNNSYSLNERIAYLKSPKGLAYHEYLYYIKKHFPMFLPYSFIMLWLKTFFPFVWETIKN